MTKLTVVRCAKTPPRRTRTASGGLVRRLKASAGCRRTKVTPRLGSRTLLVNVPTGAQCLWSTAKRHTGSHPTRREAAIEETHRVRRPEEGDRCRVWNAARDPHRAPTGRHSPHA